MAISNFSGLNVATQQGEGAANVLQWQNLDRAAQQIQAQQRERERQGFNEYLAMQAGLQKELGNVRSADQQDAMQLYQKQKALKQELLFNPKVKRDPLLYNKLKNESDLATSEFYTFTRGSNELGQVFKKLPDSYLGNPSKYNEGAGEVIRGDISKPMNQLMKEGWNESKYVYDGSDYNLGTLLQRATGAKQKYRTAERKSEDNLQMLQDVYEGFNNPEQFHSVLLNSFADRKAERAASLKYQELSPDNVKAVNSAFDAIPESEWKKWGLSGKPKLFETPYESDAKKYADYTAKLYAISNIPKNPNVETRDLKKEQMDYRAAISERLIKLNQKFQLDKANNETVTFGQGAAELAKRAKNAIANGTPEEADRQLKEYVGTLFSGNGKYVLDPNIGGIGADGKFHIIYHGRYRDGTPIMEEPLVKSFDLEDDNVVQKIDGFFQDIMSADAKIEGQNVKSAIKKVGTTVPPSTPPKKRKKIIY